MIDSEYYKNYRGPNLTLAQIWKHGEEKLDITEHIKEYYGFQNNWNGKLYTYDDIFPHKDHKYKFRVEFVDDSVTAVIDSAIYISQAENNQGESCDKPR